MSGVRVIGPAEADAVAALHASAFDQPWAAADFERLLAATGAIGLASTDGFILCWAAADEAEVLTLAVRPEARRSGQASALLRAAALHAATAGARALLLEVAEGNAPARALYQKFGFVEVGRRRGYYRHAENGADALVLRLELAGSGGQA